MCLYWSLFPRPPIFPIFPEVPIHTSTSGHPSAIMADRTSANVWPRVAALPSWQCGCDSERTRQRGPTSCDVTRTANEVQRDAKRCQLRHDLVGARWIRCASNVPPWANVWPRVASLPSWHVGCDVPLRRNVGQRRAT